METVVRNVRDLEQSDRSVLERVVGHPLHETQQVIVNVVNLEPAETPSHETLVADVPEWWNVYRGLSDEEVDRLDQAIRPRVNLTRQFE